MLVVLPVLCFAIFFLTYAARSGEPGPLTRWRTSFLSAAVTWGLAVTASTEMLSLFQLITFGVDCELLDWTLCVGGYPLLVSKHQRQGPISFSVSSPFPALIYGVSVVSQASLS